MLSQLTVKSCLPGVDRSSVSALTSYTASRRMRALASDRRAGTYPRGRVRRAHRDYVRRHVRILLLAFALFGATTAVPAFIVRSELGRGVVIGLGVAGSVGVLCQWIVMATGTGPLMMGELAEQWTASELRKLCSEGWRLVNHFSLDGRDMDHVLVGPGGIVVLETKWSATAWDDGWHADRIARAASSVGESAKRLALWHEMKTLQLPPPKSAVLLWGGDESSLPMRPSGPVHLLHGSQAARRIRAFPTDVLSAHQVEQAWTVLDKHAATRDPADARNWPMPPSAGELAGRLAVSVLTGLGAFVAAVEILDVTRSGWITVLASIGLGAAASPLRRFARARLVVTGWQTGIATVLVLIAATAGSLILR